MLQTYKEETIFRFMEVVLQEKNGTVKKRLTFLLGASL